MFIWILKGQFLTAWVLCRKKQLLWKPRFSKVIRISEKKETLLILGWNASDTQLFDYRNGWLEVGLQNISAKDFSQNGVWAGDSSPQTLNGVCIYIIPPVYPLNYPNVSNRPYIESLGIYIYVFYAFIVLARMNTTCFWSFFRFRHMSTVGTVHVFPQGLKFPTKSSGFMESGKFAILVRAKHTNKRGTRDHTTLQK